METSHAASAAEKGTKYVVLGRREHDGETWVEVNSGVSAVSASAAIRKVVGAANGEYVAIPERSWKPVKVTVSQETVVKLGGA